MAELYGVGEILSGVDPSDYFAHFPSRDGIRGGQLTDLDVDSESFTLTLEQMLELQRDGEPSWKPIKSEAENPTVTGRYNSSSSFSHLEEGYRFQFNGRLFSLPQLVIVVPTVTVTPRPTNSH